MHHETLNKHNTFIVYVLKLWAAISELIEFTTVKRSDTVLTTIRSSK